MEKVGVEAIVEGLSSFLGDMNKINSSLQGVRGEGTFLQQAFASVTDGILSFGEHVARVAEVALGVLLRDAIRAAVDFIQDLIQKTIDAGNEFQVLEIRLGRLNFNTLVEDGVDYNDALRESVELTKEQLKWLQLLAAQSPYDATDVANTFTLARSYGFASDEASSLTEDILDFASGMGLGNTEIKRIITNFGQMTQQGKATQREMNDLARGAFVPVNDILKIMSEQTGIAMEDMDDFRKTGESVPAFIEAFSTLVETRFSGATEQMSQTFQAASDNVLDLVKGIFGLNTVKPVLDVVGQAVADFANAFTNDPERWDKLTEAASRLGESIGEIVQDILGLGPSSEELADRIVNGVGELAAWVEEHKDDIVGFVKDFISNIGELKDKVVDFVENKIIPAWQKLSDWYAENKGTISEFFTAIGDIAKEFFSDLMGGREGAEEDGKGFLEILTDIMNFVIENKDEITTWVEVLWSLFVVWQVISTILSIVIGIFVSIIGFVISVIGAISGLIGILVLLANPIFFVIAAVGLLAAAWISWGDDIKLWINNVVAEWNQFWFTIRMAATFYLSVLKLWIKAKFDEIKGNLSNTWEAIKSKASETWENLKQIVTEAGNKIASADFWIGIGRSIVDGIANGISSFAGRIADAARNAARSAYNAATDALGIRSPSKLFFDIGANAMEGMALGIQNAAGIVATSMQGAMATVASAAVPSVTNSTVYNSTANYNLTVNSSAQSEPIVQDFNMMSSLAGV